MYEIKVLSSQEFDNLPPSVTRGSRINDSLGFADPLTKKAYVRYSHYPELTKYLISHELEELMADSSTHEDENGIRHKKFFKEIALPTWTGYNPSKGKMSPWSVGNWGPAKEGDPAYEKRQAEEQRRQEETMGGYGFTNPFLNFQNPVSQMASSFSRFAPAASTGVGSPFGKATSEAMFGQVGQGGISQDVLQRLRGIYSGRQPFDILGF